MIVDESFVHYLLKKEFGEVVYEPSRRLSRLDYPMLYDDAADMRGHVVLLPDFERPGAEVALDGSLCICMSDASLKAASSAGFEALKIEADVTFRTLYNHMQEVFVRVERMDAQLKAYVDSYARFDDMLETCARTTGCSFMLIDGQYRLICKSEPLEDAGALGEVVRFGSDMLEAEVIDLFMASSDYRHKRMSRNVFAMPGAANLFMKNVFANGELVGVLIAQHNGSVLHARFVRFLLGYLETFVEQLYSRVGSFGTSSTRLDQVRHAIQAVVAGEALSQAALESALVNAGHDPDAEYVVALIERSFTNEGEEGRAYLARRLELAWPGVYCFLAEGKLYLLADISNAASEEEAGRDFLRYLPTVARDSLLKVGLSRVFREMSQFGAALLQAQAAFAQGSFMEPSSWVYRFDDYALEWLLSRARGGLPADCVCHPAVSELARYDSEHNAELLDTLAAFIRCRYNATAAADELYVARSTLLNRLERICALTGVALDNHEERLYLELSLALWRTGRGNN